MFQYHLSNKIKNQTISGLQQDFEGASAKKWTDSKSVSKIREIQPSETFEEM